MYRMVDSDGKVDFMEYNKAVHTAYDVIKPLQNALEATKALGGTICVVAKDKDGNFLELDLVAVKDTSLDYDELSALAYARLVERLQSAETELERLRSVGSAAQSNG